MGGAGRSAAFISLKPSLATLSPDPPSSTVDGRFHYGAGGDGGGPILDELVLGGIRKTFEASLPPPKNLPNRRTCFPV